MRTKKHYEDMLDKNKKASIGFTLAADMVYAARHGNIVRAEAHRGDEWRNIARMLKQKYGENLEGDQVRCEIATERIVSNVAGVAVDGKIHRMRFSA